VGFLFISHKISRHYEPETLRSIMAKSIKTPSRQYQSAHRLPFNVDLLAIGIGLALAALIRFGVIHQISF
jgi:hypothetical protein